jgi:Flp pilus assembly protein TadG
MAGLARNGSFISSVENAGRIACRQRAVRWERICMSEVIRIPSERASKLYSVVAMLRGLALDRKGVTAVVTALGGTAIIGFTGLAIDVGSWEVTLHKMQGAADQAALAALIVSDAGGDKTTEAKAVSASHSFVDGQANVTVTVNQPPSAGSYTASSSALEVVISQPQSLMFTGLFLSTAPTVTARAVALSVAGSMCVMALDKTGKTAVGSVDLTGKTAVSMPNCDVYNSSPDAKSTELVGSASLNARNIFLAGGYSVSGGGSMTASGSLKTYATPMPDPYAGLTMPTYSGCTNTEVKNNTIKTPSPNVYVYCGGITVNSGSTLNLSAGTYILDQGNFTVNGGATVTGTGVTIILTSSTGSSYGAVTINGGATVTLSAPTSGATSGIPGIAIWVDKNAPMATDKFDGGSTENITGAIYAPTGQVVYSGGSSTATGCTQLVALTVTFNGNANFGNNCTGSGISEPLLPPALVE